MLALPRRQLDTVAAATPLVARKHDARPRRPGSQTGRQAPPRSAARRASLGIGLVEGRHLMSHTKCLHCRARVWRDTSAHEPAAAADLCPGCGGELQAVDDLSELVGLRALRVRPHQTHRDPDEHFERISQQIRDTIAAHDAEREARRRPDTT